MKTRLLSLFVLVSMALASVAAAPDQERTPPPPAGPTPPWAAGVQASSVLPQVRAPGEGIMSAETLRGLLPKLSGGAQQVLIPKLGVTSIAGKALNLVQAAEMDNIINADDDVGENNPTLAVNPKNSAIVAAASHYYTASGSKACVARASFDGGESFDYNNDVLLPLQASGHDCANPVARFSPDGLYAYYFYMDMYHDDNGTPGDPSDDTTTSDIVMVRADGHDPTNLLTGPIVVLNDYGDFLDKPWGDVAYYDFTGASNGAVYVTATRFASSGDCGILFNASTDKGNTWTYGDTGLLLDNSSGCSPVVVSGSRPIGNPSSGWVTACWYNSRSDGPWNGQFNINCWSNDAWGDAMSGNNYSFTAVNGMKYELPYYLGPNGTYHRWWGGMFPSLAVDNTGLLYVAFAADPTSNPNDVESGNVYLARGWPIPGLWWGAPLVVGSNPSTVPQLAQGFPTVTARCDGRTMKCYSYIAYFDHLSSNKFYNIVYRKGTRPFSYSSIGTLGLSGKAKINDVTSWSDNSFIGDYIDSSVISGRRYHVIWTDRADVYSKYDYDDDVMHDVLVP